MIPKILWQTWKTHVIPTELILHKESWKLSNPDLEIKLYSDQECEQFIKNEFGEKIHFLYMSLPHPIMRADFWRIAIIYQYGGYYGDLDITCNISLNELINPSVNTVFIKEINNIANFFFAAEAKHPVLKLALDYMIEESQAITDKNTQSFGMHSLHRAVREYYNVIGIDYPNNDQVQILNNEQLKNENKLIHVIASLTGSTTYQSWRDYDRVLQEKRKHSADILFFTTFSENGYQLYGKSWIESFIKISNFYPTVKAKIYYEGAAPIPYSHPNLTIVNYRKELSHHRSWKDKFMKLSKHDGYVRDMTVRFSFKSFVIQDVLDKHDNDFLIWLDGDCVFLPSDYTNFPKNLLQNKFLACQVEENWDLNHVESGILIFDGKHPDKLVFNDRFKKNYIVEELLPMGQPYDGFVIFRSLLMSKLDYVNLNKGFGRGGIQSDPTMTFLHPEIKSRFVHNIGWTGKHKYENWEEIFQKDELYKSVQRFLFGNNVVSLKQKLDNTKSHAKSLLDKKRKLFANKSN